MGTVLVAGCTHDAWKISGSAAQQFAEEYGSNFKTIVLEGRNIDDNQTWNTAVTTQVSVSVVKAGTLKILPNTVCDISVKKNGLVLVDDVLTQVTGVPVVPGDSLYEGDVLMVTAPQLPQVPNFVRDVSHGKRSCFLDYTVPEDSQKLHELVKDADIFLEGYRPGSMEKHGFGPEDLLKDKKGLIYVSVDCFGPGGVYSDRAGWDQVAQAVTGIAITEGELEKAGQPKLTPVYACDFLTGFMGAFGAMVALRRRALEGGSYVVRVSLCQSAMLLQREGLVTGFENAPGKLGPQTFESLAVCDDGTIYGDLKTLGPVIRMSETNPRWNGTTPELGSSEAAWW